MVTRDEGSCGWFAVTHGAVLGLPGSLGEVSFPLRETEAFRPRRVGKPSLELFASPNRLMTGSLPLMAQGGRRPLFRTLAFRRVGDLVIVVHADVAPDQQEFEAALPLCRSTEVIGLLVLTKGGALNALQRRQVASVRDGNSWRIAVLSDNLKWSRSSGHPGRGLPFRVESEIDKDEETKPIHRTVQS